METIVVYSQRVGSTNYLPADKIEVEPLIKQGFLNEGIVAHLTRNGELAPATDETMKVALARRPGDAPWPPRGFTEAYLEERGWIEKKAAPEKKEPAKPKAAPKAAKEPKKDKADATASKPVDVVELTDEKIAVGANFLQPVRRGNLRFYAAVNAEGRVLRDALFPSRNLDKATAFLEALSTSAAEADTPRSEETEEQADGGDIRSDAGEQQGQGSPEDR